MSQVAGPAPGGGDEPAHVAAISREFAHRARVLPPKMRLENNPTRVANDQSSAELINQVVAAEYETDVREVERASQRTPSYVPRSQVVRTPEDRRAAREQLFDETRREGS